MQNNKDAFSAGKFYFVIVLVMFTSTSGSAAIYTMLSKLYRVFDDPLQIGWIVAAYFLVSSVSGVLGGRLGDLIGRRELMLCILPLGAIGSLISALAPNIETIIAGATLQGVVGALTPLTIGLVRETMPREKIPFAISMVTGATYIGGGLIFLIAGMVVDRFSWQGGFYMKVILSLVTMIPLTLFIPHRQVRQSLKGIRLLGGICFAPAIAAFFIAMQVARSNTWNDPAVFAWFFVSVLLFFYWMSHEWRQEKPLIDVRLLLTKEILLGNLGIGLLSVGTLQASQTLSLLLQQSPGTGAGFGLSATTAGTVMMLSLFFAFIGSPVSGILANRRGARPAALIGAGFAVLGWGALIFEHQSLWMVMLALVLITLGKSITQPAFYNIIAAASPIDRASEAAGLNFAVLGSATAIGSQIIFYLLATSVVSDMNGSGKFPSDAAYSAAFTYVAATSILCLIVAWALPKNNFKK